VTECTWFTENQPEEARAFWHLNYPTMGTVAQNVSQAEALGLDAIDSFPLPTAAWWDNYYTPLLDRIAALRPTASGDLIGVLDETEREINMYPQAWPLIRIVFIYFVPVGLTRGSAKRSFHPKARRPATAGTDYEVRSAYPSYTTRQPDDPQCIQPQDLGLRSTRERQLGSRGGAAGVAAAWDASIRYL